LESLCAESGEPQLSLLLALPHHPSYGMSFLWSTDPLQQVWIKYQLPLSFWCMHSQFYQCFDIRLAYIIPSGLCCSISICLCPTCDFWLVRYVRVKTSAQMDHQLMAVLTS
jgi:hypothetical protein